ncbi:hypothetical protein IKQ26_04155 [bacterium]|nr:hypothetical protein [bacterium]
MINITPAIQKKYCLEKGPGGEPGVWSRYGGDDCYFTPLTELLKREQAIEQIKHTQASKVESPEEYYKRKINSHEWMG